MASRYNPSMSGSAKEPKVAYRGRVENGVVVMDGPRPPDGAKVSVRVLSSARPGKPAPQSRTLYERLERVIGKAKGLPPDASVNHDHYLYGAPKRE